MAENEIQAAEEPTAEVKTETNEPVDTNEAGDTEQTIEASEEIVAEEISYHAVENEGEITAIWEMQGQKHLRTIDPRSQEGKKIFSLFTSEIHETDSPPMANDAPAN